MEQDLSGFRLEGSSSAPREIPVSISSAAATLGGEVVSEPSGGSSHTHTQPEAAAAVPPSSNSNADHASAALAVEASASERVQLASSEVEAAVGAEAEVAQVGLCAVLCCATAVCMFACLKLSTETEWAGVRCRARLAGMPSWRSCMPSWQWRRSS